MRCQVSVEVNFQWEVGREENLAIRFKGEVRCEVNVEVIFKLEIGREVSFEVKLQGE